MKQTHVEVPKAFNEATGRVKLNNDNIGYVESYDFSKANLSNESRIAAISTVASVCYQSPKAAGSISLYNRLACESASLPSSSFEFVPILIATNKLDRLSFEPRNNYMKSSIKYGEVLVDESGVQYLLTNLRALISDVGDKADQFFNTEDECAIIAKHHKVFKAKIDIATRTQYIRHRVSWQELSRRYVSGKKSEFEFYISPRLQGFKSKQYWSINGDDGYDSYTTEEIVYTSVNHYNELVDQGVKPEEARRILPQCMYTTIWSAWLPNQLDSYLKLRTDSHTQVEHRELAEGMKTLSYPTIKAEIAV